MSHYLWLNHNLSFLNWASIDFFNFRIIIHFTILFMVVDTLDRF